jgi:hypothetical protein
MKIETPFLELLQTRFFGNRKILSPPMYGREIERTVIKGLAQEMRRTALPSRSYQRKCAS